MAWPPIWLCASIRITEAPASRATMAAGNPVAPDPITTTSAASSQLGGTLHIQNEALALAAGAADHDRLVRRLLFFAENRIVVLGNAGDDARDAFAADAEFARIVDVDAGLVEDFENLPALRDKVFLTRFR